MGAGFIKSLPSIPDMGAGLITSSALMPDTEVGSVAGSVGGSAMHRGKDLAGGACKICTRGDSAATARALWGGLAPPVWCAQRREFSRGHRDIGCEGGR